MTLGNGSNDILDLVARAYLAPGLNAVFSEHAFAVYPIATQAVGAEGRAVKARAMAGLAGAYLSLAYTPMWAENMTAGRGWIALALVVFASWRVFRVLLGAWLFGLASILHLVAQGIGLSIPANLLAMLPYAATILVLVLLSRDALRTRLYAPVSLGQPWKAGH